MQREKAMKKLFILLLIFLVTGCVASGSVKTEQVLTPLTGKIFMEQHDQNSRSYHMDMSNTFQAQLVAIQTYGLNGVQDVRILPYQVFVKKSPLFKWETIEPDILRILQQ